MRTAVFGCTVALGIGAFSCGSGSSDKVIPPKLSSIQKEIFDETCNAPSCHGSGMKGGLSLTTPNAYRQLIAVPGTTDKKNSPPLMRVKPGSPDSSLLFVVITSPDTNQGEIMPKGNERLSPNKVEAIRRWILAGAPDN